MKLFVKVNKDFSFVVEGGAKGPGLFCVLPCVDTSIKVDLRTATFNVPPQEVRFFDFFFSIKFQFVFLGFNTRFSYCLCGCCCL